jgi:hypothetical protein
MMQYTTTHALARVRLAGRRCQAQRATPARAARQARRAGRRPSGPRAPGGPGRRDCPGWPAKASTSEFVMAPGGHPGPAAAARQDAVSRQVVTAARCASQFASGLRRPDVPAAAMTPTAIKATVRRTGIQGCRGLMAPRVRRPSRRGRRADALDLPTRRRDGRAAAHRGAADGAYNTLSHQMESVSNRFRAADGIGVGGTT